MLIKKSGLRKLIRNIIKEDLPSIVKNIKQVAGVEQAGNYAKQGNIDLIVLTNQKRFGNANYVIVMSTSEPLIKKSGKPVVAGSGFSNNWQYVLGGKANEKNIKEKESFITSRSFVMKYKLQAHEGRPEDERYFGQNFKGTRKILSMLKEAMTDGRIAVVDVNNIQNSLEGAAYDQKQQLYDDLIDKGGIPLDLATILGGSFITQGLNTVRQAAKTKKDIEKALKSNKKGAWTPVAFDVLGFVPGVDSIFTIIEALGISKDVFKAIAGNKKYREKVKKFNIALKKYLDTPINSEIKKQLIKIPGIPKNITKWKDIHKEMESTLNLMEDLFDAIGNGSVEKIDSIVNDLGIQ